MINSEPMQGAIIDGHQELIITPSNTSSANDFDFFVGSWIIKNKKLKTRLNGCDEWIEFEAKQDMRKILRGTGNMDSFYTLINNEPFEGMSLRLFNPITRLWSIYWADSNMGVLDLPVIGSFDKGIGEFYGYDMCNGVKVIARFRWDSNYEQPIWSQALSNDLGKTWEWNWYMTCVKIN